MFEVSILIKTLKNIFLKGYAHAIKGNFFCCFQNIRKRKLFKLVRIRFEKQFSEQQKKKYKTNVRNLNLGEKWQKYLFSKNIC